VPEKKQKEGFINRMKISFPESKKKYRQRIQILIEEIQKRVKS